jgi:hypothetical protein
MHEMLQRKNEHFQHGCGSPLAYLPGRHCSCPPTNQIQFKPPLQKKYLLLHLFRFDVSKPWSLGVFLTCQVRLEQPDSRKQQQQPLTGTAAAPAQAAASLTAVGGDTIAAGTSRRLSSGSNGSSGLAAIGTSDSSSSSSSSSRVAQQQQQLVMELVDFGFVSTSATIAVREAGGSKRMEKSWEHAVVSDHGACFHGSTGLGCDAQLSLLHAARQTVFAA